MGRNPQSVTPSTASLRSLYLLYEVHQHPVGIAAGHFEADHAELGNLEPDRWAEYRQPARLHATMDLFNIVGVEYERHLTRIGRIK